MAADTLPDGQLKLKRKKKKEPRYVGTLGITVVSIVKHGKKTLLDLHPHLENVPVVPV